MVTRDPYASSNESERLTPNTQLRYMARPVDRLAAQIFDLFVVLTPLFLVLTAPFKVRLYHGFLVENQDEILLSTMANVVIGCALFIVYNGIGTWRWGATLGKHLFYLKVCDIWSGQRLGFWRSMGRGCVSAFSFLTMGLAFLPMLSNPRRRSLGDLCFDCEITSERPTIVSGPEEPEKWLVRGVFSLALVCLIVGVALLCHSIFVPSMFDGDVSAWLNDRAAHCEAVDEAVSEWPTMPSGKKDNRLRVTLALYAAGLVDRSCLQSESESAATFSAKPGPLYYLAQSFVHADEPDVSDSYLEHVCQTDPKSSSCQLSVIVSAWSSEDWDSLEAAFDQLREPDIVASVWAIRHFMKHGEPERAFEWIGKISPNKPLGTFLSVQRTKALWLMSRAAEARISAVQALESLPEEWQEDLAAWMCVQETNMDCKTDASASCRWLQSNKPNLGDNDAGVAVALLKSAECSGSPDVNYGSLSNAFGSASWHKLLKSAAQMRSGDIASSRQLLEEIMDNDRVAGEIRAEAYRRYISLADIRGLQALNLHDLPDSLQREVQMSLKQELGRRHMDRLPASVEKDGP